MNGKIIEVPTSAVWDGILWRAVTVAADGPLDRLIKQYELEAEPASLQAAFANAAALIGAKNPKVDIQPCGDLTITAYFPSSLTAWQKAQISKKPFLSADKLWREAWWPRPLLQRHSFAPGTWRLTKQQGFNVDYNMFAAIAARHNSEQRLRESYLDCTAMQLASAPERANTVRGSLQSVYQRRPVPGLGDLLCLPLYHDDWTDQGPLHPDRPYRLFLPDGAVMVPRDQLYKSSPV